MAMATASGEVTATGRRKTAVARVRVKSGTGQIVINGRPIDEYFPAIKDRVQVSSVLAHVGHVADVDIRIRVAGGGSAGQAGACRLGVARAIKTLDGETAETLRAEGMLTRDGRMKERKKYGLRGARRGTQFSKR
jgi:small subunit ribosomal protein S9